MTQHSVPQPLPPIPSAPPPSPALSSLAGFWDMSQELAAPAPIDWLWQGYLAPGNVTLLISQWKSGKTTLVSVLLAHMAAGGKLAGLPVRPAKVVVISEEWHMNWAQRSQKLHFGKNVTFLCRPFAGKPTKQDWATLIDTLVKVRHDQGLDLLVIDPLVTFLPGHQENVADGLMDVLLTLQNLTRLGVCVLILHHPRKGQVRAGQAARGSGALGGFADILLEMSWYRQPSDPDRRRVIEAYSRQDATPRRLVLELTADGTDYLSHGDLREDDTTANWNILHDILASAERPPTRADVRRSWPKSAPQAGRSNPLALARAAGGRRRRCPAGSRLQGRSVSVSITFGRR